MDKELRDELEVLRISLQIVADDISDIQTIINSLKKLCPQDTKDKKLCKIFNLTKKIENKFSDMERKIYSLASNDKNSFTIEDIMSRIKIAIEKGCVTAEEY